MQNSRPWVSRARWKAGAVTRHKQTIGINTGVLRNNSWKHLLTGNMGHFPKRTNLYIAHNSRRSSFSISSDSWPKGASWAFHWTWWECSQTLMKTALPYGRNVFSDNCWLSQGVLPRALSDRQHCWVVFNIKHLRFLHSNEQVKGQLTLHSHQRVACRLTLAARLWWAWTVQ